MDDETENPPKELPPSDQPWDANQFTDARNFMDDWAGIIFEFYRSLCKRGFSDSQALSLAQLWQTQYWGIILALWYGGKSSSKHTARTAGTQKPLA